MAVEVGWAHRGQCQSSHTYSQVTSRHACWPDYKRRAVRSQENPTPLQFHKRATQDCHSAIQVDNKRLLHHHHNHALNLSALNLSTKKIFLLHDITYPSACLRHSSDSSCDAWYIHSWLVLAAAAAAAAAIGPRLMQCYAHDLQRLGRSFVWKTHEGVIFYFLYCITAGREHNRIASTTSMHVCAG